MNVPELPIQEEMWTVFFEGEDTESIDVYIEPEWHNGIGPLCCTIRIVNCGQVVSYHELDPLSLRKELVGMLAYLEEMITRRKEQP